MSTLTINASFTRPRESIDFKNPDHRLSTRNLSSLDDLLKVAAAFTVYTVNPIQTVNGALCGAAIRYMGGDPFYSREERSERASRIASICFTGIGTAFALSAPGPHIFIPFILGISAAADGAFGLMHRFAGSSKNNV